MINTVIYVYIPSMYESTTTDNSPPFGYSGFPLLVLPPSTKNSQPSPFRISSSTYYKTVSFLSHCHYRPQRSCGKVMFLHLSVSHSVQRGVYPSMHWGRHPLGIHIPVCTGADTPRADISQYALWQTPPGQTYPSMYWGRHPPPGRRLLLRTVRILLECILV